MISEQVRSLIFAYFKAKASSELRILNRYKGKMLAYSLLKRNFSTAGRQ
jgi:hypothetical protein